MSQEKSLFYFLPPLRISQIGNVKHHLMPVISIPKSCFFHKPATQPHLERKQGGSSGWLTEKLLRNFKGPLEATYGQWELEVRAPARSLFLFSHSRPRHTQKSKRASKFSKCLHLTVSYYYLPQRSSTSSALKVEAEGVTHRKK